MSTQYNIIKHKNYIVLTSTEENSAFEFKKSLKNYFVNNKKNHTHYAIISEFVYGKKDFQMTSTSIEDALDISDKNLRTKLKDLEKDKYLFEFKFSMGKDLSQVYYFINLSSNKLSKHLSLSILLNQFNELYNYSLITYSSTLPNISTDELKKLKPMYDYFKKYHLKTLSISPISEKFILSSIYETVKDNVDDLLEITEKSESDHIYKHIFTV